MWSQKLDHQTADMTWYQMHHIRRFDFIDLVLTNNKWLSYRRETTLQGGLVMAIGGGLELGDNILWTI